MSPAVDLMDIFSIFPINKVYDNLFEDVFSLSYILVDYKKYLPDIFYVKLKRNNEHSFYSVEKNGEICQSEELVEKLIAEKTFAAVKSSYLAKGSKYTFEYDGGAGLFYINGAEASKQAVIDQLNQLSDDYLIMKTTKGEVVEYSAINREPLSCYYINGDCQGKEQELRELSLSIARHFPEIEYMHFTFMIDGERIYIVKVDTGMDLPNTISYNEDVLDYVKDKIKEKREKRTSVFVILYRYIYSIIASHKGFEDFMYRNWRRGKRQDTRSRCGTYRDLRWAHKRGFYSYRIEQYGLTEDNYKDFLSDYQYKRLRPINNVYKKWLWGKMSFNHILRKYRAVLPEYYYHIIVRKSGMVIRNIFAENNSFTDDIQGIFNLLDVKKKLVLKPIIGSHGEGFYKIESRQGEVFINDAQASRDELEQLILGFKASYAVTEYIELNQELKKIYPNVTSTIRMMVINRNGNDPVAEDAYFRFGTSQTGQTDNIADGGIYARINVNTGQILGGHIIENHIIKECNVHPDTGVAIDGFVPHWDMIVNQVVEVCRYIFPIEYMGFDIAVTDEGFKIIEINTHQDLHRYPEYNDNVKKYFNDKLKQRGQL